MSYIIPHGMQKPAHNIRIITESLGHYESRACLIDGTPPSGDTNYSLANAHDVVKNTREIADKVEQAPSKYKLHPVTAALTAIELRRQARNLEIATKEWETAAERLNPSGSS